MLIDDEVKLLKTKLIIQTAKHILDMDDAYPDVGPGKSWNVCVYEALTHHGISKDEVYMDKLIY